MINILLLLVLSVTQAFSQDNTKIEQLYRADANPDNSITVMAYPYEATGIVGKTAQNTTPKQNSVDPNLFSSSLNKAIKAVENGLSNTCAKEIELSLTVSAEGKFEVVGFGVSGSMKTTVLNPKLPETCGKPGAHKKNKNT